MSVYATPNRRPLRYTGGGPTAQPYAYSGGGNGAMDTGVDRLASGLQGGPGDPGANASPDVALGGYEKAYGTEVGSQARRRGYYEGREAGADENADQTYDRYRGGVDDLLGSSYQTPLYSNEAVDPGTPGYGTFDASRYGEQDGGDLSRYGEKDFYGSAATDQIDPNSGLGKLLDAYQGTLKEKDYSGDYGRLVGAANDQLTNRIQHATADLESSAAGRGRLDSSLFSKDAGSLYRDLATDTRSTLSQGALTAEGLNEADRSGIRSAYGNLTGSTIDALNLNRQAGIQRGEAAAAGGYRRASIAQGNRGAARAGFESDRGFGQNRYEDARNFGRGVYENDRNFGATRYDTQNNFRKGLYDDLYGTGQQRSDDAYARGEQQRSDYRDLLTGGYDRAQAAKNAKDKNKSDLWGGIIKGATTLGAAAL